MIETSQRSALYRKYEAIYYAYQYDNSFFTLTQSNTELTTVMGGRPWSWHVIGITKAALLRYKELDFRRVSKSGITRAHLIPRIKTTTKLLNVDKPYSLEEFFDIWLSADKTVICGPGENKKEFNVSYLPIDNVNYQLFNSATIGWKFRAKESKFLRSLYEKTFK